MYNIFENVKPKLQKNGGRWEKRSSYSCSAGTRNIPKHLFDALLAVGAYLFEGAHPKIGKKFVSVSVVCLHLFTCLGIFNLSFRIKMPLWPSATIVLYLIALTSAVKMSSIFIYQLNSAYII